MFKNARLGAHLVPCVALGITVVTSGCVAESDGEPVAVSAQAATSPLASTFPATYARQWMVNLANSVKGDGIHPVVAARTYTYGAIAIYEATVNGMPGYQSLGGQLNGLGAMPSPDPGKQYDWPTVLAQTMHRVVNETYVFPLRVFFEFVTMTEASLGELGPTQIGYRRVDGVAPEVLDDSIAFGNELADVLVPWILSDGYAQARFKGWIPPVGPDKWVPTSFGDTDKVANPEEAAFGTVRPIVLTTPNECAPAGPPAFSTTPGSSFHDAALEVYNLDVNQTDEQQEIARFWADGPRDTATPPGHWLALTTKYVRAGTLAQAAHGYAMASLTHLDAAIAVWWDKYHHNLLRPETYIRRHIDPAWRPFLPSPKFPAYTSGHSSFSGAAARMMKEAFGETAPIVDDTKLRRGFGVHTYATWDQAAEEAAESRLYGGIHYRFDSEDGLDVGRCIATKALARVHFQ